MQNKNNCKLVIQNDLKDNLLWRFRTITDFGHGTLPEFNVKLEGFTGNREDIKIFCVIYQEIKKNEEDKTGVLYPHPNRLIISEGKRIISIDPIESKLDKNSEATFKDLIVIMTKLEQIKTNVKEKLKAIQKYNSQYMIDDTELDNLVLLKKFDMKNIRLCFEAFRRKGQHFEAVCDPVFSKNILYSKKPMNALSWHVEGDNCYGKANGGNKMIIVCEYPDDVIKKDDLKIRFFDKNSNWKADLGKDNIKYISYCHHCLIVTTPPYQNKNIPSNRKVSFQLYGSNDLKTLEAEVKEFTYNACLSEQKRQRESDFMEVYDTIDLITLTLSNAEREQCRNPDDLLASTSINNVVHFNIKDWGFLKTDGKHELLNATSTTIPTATFTNTSNLKLLNELKIKNILHTLIEDNKNNCKLDELLRVIKDYQIEQILKLQNENGDTCLHVACYFNRFELIDKILNFDVDPNIQNNEGDTPLHIAVANKHEKCIMNILENQNYKKLKNIDLTNDKGYTALYLAVLLGEYEIAKKLIEIGKASAKFENPTNGNNILHLAVMQVNSLNEMKTIDLVNYLIEENSINLDVENHCNLTPFAIAIEIGEDAANIRF